MATWREEREVTPDPKPPRRLKAVPEEWAIIGEHFANACCVACGEGRDVSLHHITPKSQSGDDVIENLAPLCGDGTRGCHGILESHAPGWERVAAAVRVYVLTNRDRCTYAISKVGWERFNKRYPLLSEPDAGCPKRDAGSIPASASGSESDWPERKSPWDIAYEPTHFTEDR